MTLLSRMRDHAMLLVLLALAAVFSFATLRDQPQEGAAAASPLVTRALATAGKPAPRVLITAGATPEDVAFLVEARNELTRHGIQPSVASGEPSAARAELMRLAGSGAPLDLILTSRTAASWLVFADLKTDFPQLGSPVLLQPQSQRWPSFLERQNLMNVANQIAVIAIVAIGMTLVIVTGGIDLSVGSLIALSAVCAAWCIREGAGGLNAGALGLILCSLAAIVVCGLCGAASGLVITRFAMPPFIVTLAMMVIASGLAYKVTGHLTIDQSPAAFMWLGRGASLLGIPNAVVLMLLLYALADLMMKHTALGRHLYAVGGNREAAIVSGLNVKRVQLIAYTVCGLLAGLGGVMQASLFKSASANYGSGYELKVIAAVVVGGASLEGGRGRIYGTLTGAFIIAVIENGLNLLGVDDDSQKVVLGLVILGAVLTDRLGRK